MKNLSQVCIFLLILLLAACTSEKKQEAVSDKKQEVFVPAFNADSAYNFTEKQVAFGPRVPNTEAHIKTGDYLIAKLKSYNWQVVEQPLEATTFDGNLLYLRNIIASYNPDARKRILLAAHWDTRPFADKDSDRQQEPIDGANDGASGVGVLLEIARIVDLYDSLSVGLDIIFFDGEDWGERPNESVPPAGGLESWWCLGSQHWSKNKHEANYSAYFGILLDMVGGRNATFLKEEWSMQFAPSIVDKVWTTGQQLGFNQYFKNQPGGSIVDDHYFVNKYAKIPMIDIIPTDLADGSFGAFHHTHQDNMALISKETLKAVGQTVLHVVYNE